MVHNPPILTKQAVADTAGSGASDACFEHFFTDEEMTTGADGNFCPRYLTSSASFTCSHWIREKVREYELMVDQPASARFEKVQGIREKYIKQGSNFEINIETKMRNNAMKVRSPPSNQT